MTTALHNKFKSLWMAQNDQPNTANVRQLINEYVVEYLCDVIPLQKFHA